MGKLRMEEKLKFNELLNKFDNGFALYQNSALFCSLVESLFRGADVYKLLEQVSVMLDESNDRYKELIQSGKIRTEIIVSKEIFEELEEKAKENIKELIPPKFIK